MKSVTRPQQKTMETVVIVLAAVLSGGIGHFVEPPHDISFAPLIPEGSKGVDTSHILPEKWRHFCQANYRLVSGNHFTAQEALYISCDLKLGDDWLLADYRKWISANEYRIYKYLPMRSNLLVAVDLVCRDINATVSLPWPMLAEHLWYIGVQNCTILDHFSEYNVVHNVDNVLKVINIRDCVRQVNIMRMFEYMSNYLNQSHEFDCGGENVETHVYRNIIPIFTKPIFPTDLAGEQSSSSIPAGLAGEQRSPRLSGGLEPHGLVGADRKSLTDDELPTSIQTTTASSLLNEEFIIENFARIGQDNQKLENHCNYRYLKYIDKSHSYAVSKHNGHFMVERKRYPVLEFYNMSHSKMIEISPMLLQWRRYFPKMKHVDLSHNKIKYFKAFIDNGLKNDKPGVLDLRHNNIKTLTRDDLLTLRLHSRTVFIDIRDNPFLCDCKLQHLVSVLQNTSSEIVQKYKYLQKLKCANPPEHRGKIIAMLEHDFCETVAFIIMSAPFIILACVCVIMFVLLVLSIRYRKEIVILAFTRLHISLPCRQVNKEISKKYDAFIAYSEHDASWVFKVLLPKLEEPSETNGPGLKLCIHHRDFPVGGSIADNILDKITDSHHTVLVLSNNFLLSHWCKYEFKTAFTQSLMEKKQHLIMVLVEDLNKRLIDSDLKRCLKTFTYVKIDDRFLWDKLIYALSDSRRKTNVDINYNSCKKPVKSIKGVNNKLTTIKSDSSSNNTENRSPACSHSNTLNSKSSTLTPSHLPLNIALVQNHVTHVKINNVTADDSSDDDKRNEEVSNIKNGKHLAQQNSVPNAKCSKTVHDGIHVTTTDTSNSCHRNSSMDEMAASGMFNNLGFVNDDSQSCILNMSPIETDYGFV